MDPETVFVTEITEYTGKYPFVFSLCTPSTEQGI